MPYIPFLVRAGDFYLCEYTPVLPSLSGGFLAVKVYDAILDA